MIPADLNRYIELYQSLGFCIIPLRPESKKPAVEWLQFEMRRPTDAELEAWFGGAPRNIGLVCGSVSNGLTVIDFDDPDVYPRFFDAGKIEAETIVVKTHDGRRQVYLLSADPGAAESFNIPKLKMEVRGEGRFVVAPPSIHPISKQPYEFVNPHVRSVMLVPEIRLRIQERSMALGVKVHVGLEPPMIRGLDQNLRLRPLKPYRGRHPICIETLMQGVELGRRDHVTIRLAQYLLSRGMKPERVVASLIKWNRANRPPIGEAPEDPRNVPS